MLFASKLVLPVHVIILHAIPPVIFNTVSLIDSSIHLLLILHMSLITCLIHVPLIHFLNVSTMRLWSQVHVVILCPIIRNEQIVIYLDSVNYKMKDKKVQFSVGEKIVAINVSV